MTPPAQGGIQILGTVDGVDVSAHARQVPAVFVGQWMVPLQFLHRVVDIAVMLRDRYAQCQTVLFSTGY